MNSPLTICLVVLASGAISLAASAADSGKFTGSPSCASTSCHGGGTLHNEYNVYMSLDKHGAAAGLLAKGTSQRIAESLHIVGDPTKSAQCNICHAPMQGVPVERMEKEALADNGVACESCHGPAEKWLQFHTRRDATHAQMVALGMRDMNEIYNRANVCVSCHLNLDEAVRKAGHPELLFDLDTQTITQPPHYKDERPSLGARQWLTGGATALRELSWKLAGKREDALVPRWKALRWLLGKTELGKKDLPASEDFGAVQKAADQMARDASNAQWTKDQLVSQLKDYVGVRAEFADPKADKAELRRRAEVLVPALAGLWRAYKKETGMDSPSFDGALKKTYLLALQGDYFDPSKFAPALDELQTALSKTGK